MHFANTARNEAKWLDYHILFYDFLHEMNVKYLPSGMVRIGRYRLVEGRVEFELGIAGPPRETSAVFAFVAGNIVLYVGTSKSGLKARLCAIARGGAPLAKKIKSLLGRDVVLHVYADIFETAPPSQLSSIKRDITKDFLRLKWM